MDRGTGTGAEAVYPWAGSKRSAEELFPPTVRGRVGANLYWRSLEWPGLGAGVGIV